MIRTLLFMLDQPTWLLLLLAMGLMSLVYAGKTVWDLPVAVVDLDKSNISRELIRSLNATPKIEIKSYNNLPEARNDLIRRKLFAVVLVPVDFEKKILHGEHVILPVYGDATNRLPNGQIQQDVIATYQHILNDYNNKILLRAGFSQSQADLVLQPVKKQTVDLFNPGISYAAIIFPGLLVMLLQHSLLIAFVRVSIAVRSIGKLTLSEYAGALSALIPVWLFLSVVMFILWPWVLGYRQSATIAEIILLTFPFLISVMGLGKFLTECLRKVELIYLSLSFMTMPVFYISGTIWPLQAMPAWVRGVSLSLPSTWGVKMITGINQMDLRFSDVIHDMLMMLLLGAVYALSGYLLSIIRDSAKARSIFKKMRF
ncbi:ABC-2 type transporter superfamily [Escherichia coli TA206]|nr:ABC-2 type transporter superfamily [Escherichia coli TA206]